VSKETNRLMGHADEADGIEEYDNPLPDWWLGLFWFTIIWAVGYSLHYHVIADRSQEKHLAAEMAAADARWPEQVSAPDLVEITPEAVAAGQPVYAQNCAPCHGADLEGVIGPGFLDDEWIHGGTASDVLRVIREGVLDKGMVAWQGILPPEQIANVAAYILSRHAEATGRSMEDILGAPGGEG
jgi:cytochrome c oxidase cbb3-type subunit III